MNGSQLTAELKQRARSAGLDLCGIAPAAPSQHARFLREWLETGRHGEMAWMASRFEERADVRNYLPGAKAVICCAISWLAPTSLATTPSTMTLLQSRRAPPTFGTSVPKLMPSESTVFS